MRYNEFSPLQRGILACSLANRLADHWPSLQVSSYSDLAQALAEANPACSITNEDGAIVQVDHRLAQVLRDRGAALFPRLYAPDFYEANKGQSIPVPEWMVEQEAEQAILSALDLDSWEATSGTGQLVLVCSCSKVEGSLGQTCRSCGYPIQARLP